MRFGSKQTFYFTKEWLAQPCRVLEVGCGDGELALMLAQGGYEVVAIDSDPAVVSEAKARGVDARVAVWPAFDDEPFDAVLFTRSLHHIEPLDAAVARARELLRPGGRVIIEDFAPYEMSAPFMTWLRGELAQIGEEWHQDDVHHFSDMRRAIESRFKIVYDADVPYCYRYMPESDAARVFEAELALGERPLGRRMVAATSLYLPLPLAGEGRGEGVARPIDPHPALRLRSGPPSPASGRRRCEILTPCRSNRSSPSAS